VTGIQRDGDVVVVAMADERLTTGVLDMWATALDEVERDETATALVSTGTGKYYSNGLDLDAIAADPSSLEAYIERVHDLLVRVATCPIATVSAVNGHAFGAGAMLAAVHDTAVMRADRGYWCLPEVDLGLSFTPVMHELLVARLPRRTAYEAMTTSRRYGGPDAVEAGIVAETVAEEALVGRALELARDRGGKNRAALGGIKRSLHSAALAQRPDR
jgi:enoyl-CoA hydratase/carnithine racemase